MHAETSRAIISDPRRMMGIDPHGIESDRSVPLRRNKGASILRSEKIIAIRFRSPATNDMVVTYRYFETRRLLRSVARVMTVSHVEFSLSPAVESIAGCIAPVDSITRRNVGSIRPRKNCAIWMLLEMFSESTQKFW